MRSLVLAIVAIGTIGVAAPASAQSYDPNYPVCLRVYGEITYNECRYTSLAQCAASASGRAAECLVNPFAANAYQEPRHPRRHSQAY